MSEQLLSLSGVHQVYKRRAARLSTATQVHAVNGVDLTVSPGETVGVVGESGCGKSTLARLMVGLETPAQGSVYWEGQDTASMSRAEKRQFHRQVQLIFQDPHSSLNPRRTVGDSVAEGLQIHRLMPAKDAAGRIGELFEQVGLDPEATRKYPHQFSGGQLQRVGIARALAVDPKVLVCDEPVSALDISIRAQVLNLLNRLKRELNLAIVFIAHDLDVVQHMSDRILTMYLGKVVEQGETEPVYSDSAHPYTRALLSAIPSRPGSTDGSHRMILAGDPPSPVDLPAGCSFHTRCPFANDGCIDHEPELQSLSAGVVHDVACFRADEVRGSVIGRHSLD